MRYLIIFFLSLFLMGDEIKNELLNIWNDISDKEYEKVMERLQDYKTPPFEIKIKSDDMFKVYAKDGELVYLKKGCKDKEPTFFLHLFQDKKHYKNFDFDSSELFYYKNFCVGYKKLPDIPFKWIDTGQFEKNERIWWIRIKKEDLTFR